MDRFARAEKIPIYWRNCSTDLRGSAAALWFSMVGECGSEIKRMCGLGDEFSLPVAVNPVFEMLCGLSIELLFKAIAVAKGLDVPHHHRLCELAKFTGVTVTELESGLLEILTEAIQWSGRYPIPSRKEYWDKTRALRNQHLFDCVDSRSLPVIVRNDALRWDSFNAFWLKTDDVYWQHHRNA